MSGDRDNLGRYLKDVAERNVASQWARGAIAADAATATTGEAMGDLGPLPEPANLLQVMWRGEREFLRPIGDYYTADQMRAYAAAEVARERERWIAACDAERAEFAERAANNDGSRQSDFAFGSVNSSERIKAAALGATATPAPD